MIINHKFKTDHYDVEYELAANAYRILDFNHQFEKIKVKDPAITQYLKDISIEKWSCDFFPRIRYNMMTNNYAKSFTSKSREARKYPITTLVDF